MNEFSRVFPSVPVRLTEQSLVSHAGTKVITEFVNALGFRRLCEDRLGQFTPAPNASATDSSPSQANSPATAAPRTCCYRRTPRSPGSSPPSWPTSTTSSSGAGNRRPSRHKRRQDDHPDHRAATQQGPPDLEPAPTPATQGNPVTPKNRNTVAQLTPHHAEPNQDPS